MPIIHRMLGLAALVVVTTAQACADSADALPPAVPSVDGKTTAAPVASALVAATPPLAGPAPKPGKYGCTASRYNSNSGMTEYEMKGSFFLTADGGYEYHGFETPSAGRYRVEPETGKLLFQGGYFDGGEAAPVEDRPDKYFVVFPTIPDRRWTCGLAEAE